MRASGRGILVAPACVSLALAGCGGSSAAGVRDAGRSSGGDLEGGRSDATGDAPATGDDGPSASDGSAFDGSTPVGPDPVGATLPFFYGQPSVSSAIFYATTVVTNGPGSVFGGSASGRRDWVLWSRATGQRIDSGPGAAEEGNARFTVSVLASDDPGATADRVEIRDGTTGALLGQMTPDPSYGAATLQSSGLSNDDSYAWGDWWAGSTEVVGVWTNGTASFATRTLDVPLAIAFATSFGFGSPAGYFAFADHQFHAQPAAVLNVVGFLDKSAYCAVPVLDGGDAANPAVGPITVYAPDGTARASWPGAGPSIVGQACGGGVGDYVFLFDDAIAEYDIVDMRDLALPPVAVSPSPPLGGRGNFVLVGSNAENMVLELRTPAAVATPMNFTNGAGFTYAAPVGVSAEGTVMITTYQGLLHDNASPPTSYATHGQLVAQDFANGSVDMNTGVLAAASGQTMVWSTSASLAQLVFEPETAASAVAVAANGASFALGRGYPDFDTVETWSIPGRARLAQFTAASEGSSIQCFGLAAAAPVIALGAGPLTHVTSLDGTAMDVTYAMNNCEHPIDPHSFGVTPSPSGTAIASWSGIGGPNVNVPYGGTLAIGAGGVVTASWNSTPTFLGWLDDQHFEGALRVEEEEYSIYTYTQYVSYGLDGGPSGSGDWTPPPAKPVFETHGGGFLYIDPSDAGP